MALSRRKLALHLAQHVDIHFKDCLTFVDVFFDELKAALLGGERIYLAPFGNFWLVQHAARPVHDFTTGERKTYPAHIVVKFTPSKVLIERVKNTEPLTFEERLKRNNRKDRLNPNWAEFKRSQRGNRRRARHEQ